MIQKLIMDCAKCHDTLDRDGIAIKEIIKSPSATYCKECHDMLRDNVWIGADHYNIGDSV